MIKCYSEMIKLDTFDERFRYLQLNSHIGEETFGPYRYLYENFLQRDDEWKSARDYVIIRDAGCDLAIPDRDILKGCRVIVHHMNPVTVEDLLNRTRYLLDPEYLVLTIKSTHDAIHYGDENSLVKNPIERKPNDTCPWRR